MASSRHADEIRPSLNDQAACAQSTPPIVTKLRGRGGDKGAHAAGDHQSGRKGNDGDRTGRCIDDEGSEYPGSAGGDTRGPADQQRYPDMRREQGPDQRRHDEETEHQQDAGHTDRGCHDHAEGEVEDEVPEDGFPVRRRRAGIVGRRQQRPTH